MSRKCFTVDQVLDQVVSSDDEEGIGNNDYENECDFETEGESSSENDSVQDNDELNLQLPLSTKATTSATTWNAVVRGRGRTRGGSRQGSVSARTTRPSTPPEWERDISSFQERYFSPNNAPGPRNLPDTVNADSSQLDFFSLFWDDDLWKLLLTETNRNVERIVGLKPNHFSAKLLNAKPVTMEEFKAFFGLRATMEMLLYKDRYEQYWQSKNLLLTNTPWFPQVMSRNRFLAIWSLLHCVNEDDLQLDKKDKLYKTRPVFVHLIKKFKHYYVPDCELSLDEGMIPTKNKLSFKQYIKDKPIRWGIKSFLLCDSQNGYICDAEIYTGKRDDATEVDNIGVTGNLVVRMTKDFTGQNYTLYTDRFYTTVQLAEYLLTHKGIRICGTAMTNRKEFPKQLIKKPKEMQRGDSELLFNGSVAAIVWRDRRPIYFVTSAHVSSPAEHVQRYDANEHRKIAVPCPKAVKEYNSYMGGTDKNDQMTRLQKCRRHYKWPRRLVIKFFMWAAYNAYVLMGILKPHNPPGKRVFTFHFFLEQLFNELVGDIRNTNTDFGKRRSGDQNDEHRLQRDAHHDVERADNASGNNCCRVCREKYLKAKQINPRAKDNDLPKRSKTVYRCIYCDKFLCIGQPGNNCWFDWHNKQQYWR